MHAAARNGANVIYNLVRPMWWRGGIAASKSHELNGAFDHCHVSALIRGFKAPHTVIGTGQKNSRSQLVCQPHLNGTSGRRVYEETSKTRHSLYGWSPKSYFLVDKNTSCSSQHLLFALICVHLAPRHFILLWCWDLINKVFSEVAFVLGLFVVLIFLQEYFD